VPVVVEPDAWVGRVLSNVYRVEQKIGEGGMGAVYLARHIHLQKPYAIKVLTTTVANNGQAVERLKQEAIAASSIEHDNIVDVVNFDRADDGSVFIVMELLRGREPRGAPGDSRARRAARSRSRRRCRSRWQICDGAGRGARARDRAPGPEAGERVPGAQARRCASA
jgi:serine/threonine protein kinase